MPQRDPRQPGRAWVRLIVDLPERVPVLVLCLAIAGVVAVLAGQFRPWVVLPLALVLAVASWRAVDPRPAGRRVGGRDLAPVLVLLAGIATWVAVSLRYASQYVVVSRDPGFLTLTGFWLADHPSALIPVGAGSEHVVDAVAAATVSTQAAFWADQGSFYVQGNTMLPAVLAVPGWIGGQDAVLAANIGIGAVALLAVYAAARRIAGPWWALVPVAALALSLPFLTFTRSAYTEPLTVAFGFTALALAFTAWRTGADGAHVLVGTLTGAVAATRIDGAVVVVGFVIGTTIAAVGPLGRSDRAGARRGALLGITAALAVTALGLVDVLRLSPEYVRIHTPQLTSLGVVVGLVTAVALLVLVLPSRVLRPVRLAAHRHRKGAAAACVVLAGLVAAVLLSRPWWWVGRDIDPDGNYGDAVRILQTAAGVAVEPDRSYDEMTLTWLSWYFGWPAVLLGLSGVVLLVWRAVARRSAGSWVVLGVVAVGVLFTTMRVSITPDQIWAVRRLLPVTIPGLLVCAVAALAALWAVPGRRAAWRVLRRTCAAAGAVAVVLLPAGAWDGGVASVVEQSGRADQVRELCAELRSADVSRVVWVRSGAFPYLATIRVVCDVEVIELPEPATAATLAAVRRAWGGGAVAVAGFNPEVLDGAGSLAPLGLVTTTTMEHTLLRPPSAVQLTESELWAGLVRTDGRVVRMP